MKEYVDLVLSKKEKKPVDLEKICRSVENAKRKVSSNYILTEEDKSKIERILEDGVKKYDYYRTPNGNYTLFTRTSFRVGRFCGNRIGEGTVVTKTSYVGKNIKREEKTEKFYINKEDCEKAIDGDIVLIDIGGSGKKPSVKEILHRDLGNIVGEVVKDGKKYFIKPVDKKKKQLTIEVTDELAEGSIVSVSLENQKDDNYYIAKVLRKFEHADGAHYDALLEAFKSGMPEGFSEESIKQLESIPDEVREKDRDHRWYFPNMEIFSIDGEDTKDKDDCISLHMLKNGNYLLGVHIADVNYYVKEGTPIDKDAFRKGTSYYFAGIVEPQLPPKLSNEICSLNDGVERITITIFREFDPLGNVVCQKMVPSVIKSRAGFTYDKVNDVLNGEEVEGYMPYKDTLMKMKELASILRRNRILNGAIIFNKPEVRFNHDEMGNPTEVNLRYEDTAGMIIEEFMLQANIGVAEILTEKGIPCVYRTHDVPNVERLADFLKLLDAINMPFEYDVDDIIKDKKVLQLLELHINKNQAFSPMLNTNLVRCMSHAVYSTNNIGHYGIGSECYCHFTSPIRRIADLAISRIISECVFERDKSIRDKNIKKWKDLAVDYASQASKMEKLEEEVEKNVLYMETAKYLSNFIGEEFEGTVVTVSDKGISVQLDNLLEGKVRTRYLDGDYVCNASTFTLLSLENKGNYYLGDRLKLRLESTSIDTKTVDFTIISKIKENTIKDKYHSNQYVKSRVDASRLKKGYI